MLVAVDVGNVNTKFRKNGRGFVAKPSLVRTPTDGSYSFENGAKKTPTFVYESGPAKISSQPFVVGEDAQRSGVGNLAAIGSAAVRVKSDAYLVLHLWGIIASLPAGQTIAELDFVGGLPMQDYTNESIAQQLTERLVGTHRVTYARTTYQITIRRAWFPPQAVAAVAALIFDEHGRPRLTAETRKLRLVLDIGGGTTDYTARIGLKAVPGAEGGFRIGINHAADRARTLIREQHPELRNLTTSQVLEQFRAKKPELFVGGNPVDIRAEINQAKSTTAQEILVPVLTAWSESLLEEGEVIVVGGGGQDLWVPIHTQLRPVARVTLLPDAVFKVVEGLERTGLYHIAKEQSSVPA